MTIATDSIRHIQERAQSTHMFGSLYRIKSYDSFQNIDKHEKIKSKLNN